MVEGRAEKQQLGLCVDGRAPDARVVGGPADMGGFVLRVDITKSGCADKVAVVRAANETHRVRQPRLLEVVAGPLDELVDVGAQTARAPTVAARED